MLKKIFATFMVLSSLALTGCTVPTVANVEKFPDLTKADELIVKVNRIFAMFESSLVLQL